MEYKAKRDLLCSDEGEIHIDNPISQSPFLWFWFRRDGAVSVLT